MENPVVETLAPVAEGVQQSDPAADTVALSDLVTEYEQGIAGAQGAEATAPAQNQSRGSDAKPAPQNQEQTDFNRKLGERLYKERARLARDYESKPEYQLGRTLIQERAARDGVSAEEAARRVQADLVNNRAEQYAKDPKQFYADYLNQRQQPQQTQPTQQQPAAQGDAMTLTQQLLELGAPDIGFLPEHINGQFAEDAQTYGVPAALAMWQREQSRGASAQDIVSELEQRRRVPQPIRPVNQNAASPDVDYMQVPADQIAKMRAAMKRAQLDGRRVTL